MKAEDWSLDEEEFEDADGNVLSKKMYNDLVRQGLIWFVCSYETINVVISMNEWICRYINE